ncbi:MAG: hypothetical protein KDI88_12915 [Gammaproteobacteria bacterium]|nr:hypothetical protein [Gammaproteobacteria bacterium]
MNRSELRTWLSSVTFLDVVGFSKRSIEEQLEIKRHLDSVMREQLTAIQRDDYIFLDRGDGAAVCFLVEPETAFFFALHVRDALSLSAGERPSYDIRIGINLGPIKIIRDVNGDKAPVGEGVNCAARVMDFAGPNEILVARSFYDVIGCQSHEFDSLFSYLGVRADKHVRQFELYEVVPPGAPKKPLAAPEPAVESPAMAVTLAPEYRFDSGYLGDIRRALARAIGPMADVILSRAVKHSGSEDELLDRLGNALHDPDQRKAFFSMLGLESRDDAHPVEPCPPPANLEGAGAGESIDAQLIDSARNELAKNLGPIAAVLVKQAAASAPDAQAFVGQLAAKLTNPGERARFEVAMRVAITAID